MQWSFKEIKILELVTIGITLRDKETNYQNSEENKNDYFNDNIKLLKERNS